MFEKLIAILGSIRSHLKEVGRLRDPSELTLEDFRMELADIGLLGRSFGPDEYRAALEGNLGIEILIEELPDAEGGVLAGQLAAEGNLAEVVIDEESGNAIILVRGSLRYAPWPAYELSIFHELSHLAAGHPLRVRRVRGNGRRWFRRLGSRLALKAPLKVSSGDELEELREKILEPEARKRAKWLVLAGMCPEAFEAETANRLT